MNLRQLLGIVFGAALFGGLASFAMFQALTERAKEIEFAGRKIPIGVDAGLYDKDQVLLAIALASLCSALLAYLLGTSLRKGR